MEDIFQYFRYHVSEEFYPGSTFPMFVTGPSYMMSYSASYMVRYDTIHKLQFIYKAYTVRVFTVHDIQIARAALEENYVNLEDVFLTGIVADKLNIPRVPINFERFRDHKIPYGSKCGEQQAMYGSLINNYSNLKVLISDQFMELDQRDNCYC